MNGHKIITTLVEEFLRDREKLIEVAIIKEKDKKFTTQKFVKTRRDIENTQVIPVNVEGEVHPFTLAFYTAENFVKSALSGKSKRIKYVVGMIRVRVRVLRKRRDRFWERDEKKEDEIITLDFSPSLISKIVRDEKTRIFFKVLETLAREPLTLLSIAVYEVKKDKFRVRFLLAREINGKEKILFDMGETILDENEIAFIRFLLSTFNPVLSALLIERVVRPTLPPKRVDESVDASLEFLFGVKDEDTKVAIVFTKAYEYGDNNGAFLTLTGAYKSQSDAINTMSRALEDLKVNFDVGVSLLKLSLDSDETQLLLSIRDAKNVFIKDFQKLVWELEGSNDYYVVTIVAHDFIEKKTYGRFLLVSKDTVIEFDTTYFDLEEESEIGAIIALIDPLMRMLT